MEEPRPLAQPLQRRTHLAHRAGGIKIQREVPQWVRQEVKVLYASNRRLFMKTAVAWILQVECPRTRNAAPPGWKTRLLRRYEN